MRYIILIFGGFLWWSCGQSADTRHTAKVPGEAAIQAPSVDGSVTPVLDTNSASMWALKKSFRVEKERGNGIYLQAYIYISDESKLVTINRLLRVRYQTRFTEALDIWYFDKPHMVDRYLSAVDDHSVSDEAFERMDRHMVCQYSQLRQNEGTLDWNRP